MPSNRPHLRRFGVIVALLAVLAALLPATASAAVDTISGRVTNAAGQSLAGIEVSLYTYVEDGDDIPYWDWADSTITAADGAYHIGVTDGEQFRVGFEDWTGTYAREFWDEADHLSTATSFDVAEGSVDGIDATLEPASSIGGRVTDEGSHALGEVTVIARQLVGHGYPWITETTTAEDGTYVLDGLRAGTYRIEFVSETHAGEFWGDAAELADADDVVVSTGESRRGIDAALGVGATLSGKVTGSGGAPLADVEVTVFEPSEEWGGWMPVGYAYSDAGGVYTASGLRAGTYRLELEPEDGRHVAEYWDDAASLDVADDVTVTADGVVTGLDAALSLGSSISGKVSLPTGGTARDVDVTAYVWSDEVGWDWAANGEVRSDGTYTLGGLGPGTYTLGFYPHSGMYARQYWKGRGSVDNADRIEVGRSAHLTGKDVTLARAGSLSGVVRGASGPLADVNIDVYAQNAVTGAWSSAESGWTEEDGSYTVTGLQPGTYRVGFQDYEGVHAQELYDDSPSLSDATTVTVTAGGTTRLADAVLARASTVSGTVRRRDGAPLAAISVSAYRWERVNNDWIEVAWDETAADGSYTLRGLGRGTYRLRFDDWEYGRYLSRWWEGAGYVEDATDIVVGGVQSVTGKDVVLVDRRSELGSTARPTVAGTPVVGQQVVASPGSWTQDGLDYAYAWRADGTPILGAATSTLDVTPDLVGKRLTVVVTASASGTAPVTAPSQPTAPVRPAAPLGLTVTSTSASGATLSWAATPGASGYRVLRRSSSGSSVTSIEAGSATSATVTGLAPSTSYEFALVAVGGSAPSEPSDWVAATTKPAPVVPVIRATAVPTITGKARYGTTLRAFAGRWSVSGTAASYQWLRAGVPIPGATRATYTLGAADVGRNVSIRVTARKTGHASAAATSRVTGLVKRAARVKVAAKAGRTRVTLTVRLAVDGVVRPGGKVVITERGKQVRTVAVRGGKAVVRLSAKRGRHAYKVTYRGTRTTTPAARAVSVRVR
ncbi:MULTISPECIES: fibronectin type III domain-containing protein [Mumia]|uniref:alpha-amylase n=1 Tax=Mumia xiangluensis TaxID=1678900 RepID=A0ABW1QQX6_9ACTN|nr:MULTISPECIES: fibronectin type III domain-containing protein [Mumia]